MTSFSPLTTDQNLKQLVNVVISHNQIQDYLISFNLQRQSQDCMEQHCFGHSAPLVCLFGCWRCLLLDVCILPSTFCTLQVTSALDYIALCPDKDKSHCWLRLSRLSGLSLHRPTALRRTCVVDGSQNMITNILD